MTFPPLVELPNDDAFQTDEANVPTSAGRIYVADFPGAVPQPPITEMARRDNFQEWVRIRFDNVAPAGNTLQGSRASSVFDWHSEFWIRETVGG